MPAPDPIEVLIVRLPVDDALAEYADLNARYGWLLQFSHGRDGKWRAHLANHPNYHDIPSAVADDPADAIRDAVKQARTLSEWRELAVKPNA